MPSNDSTLDITRRVLGDSAKGEGLPLFFSINASLAALATTLLLPWPIKLVLDCVVGHEPVPASLVPVVNLLTNAASSDARRRVVLLVMLCAALIVIQFLAS